MQPKTPLRRHACVRYIQLKVKCVPDPRMELSPRTETPPLSGISNTPLQPSPVPEPLTQRLYNLGLLNTNEGEELLLKFRTDLMPLFPFVIIPEVSFVELRKQSPFFLLCIMTVCLDHKPTRQQKLELEARIVVSTRIVINMERDMDLLQGLLVHITWYHYHWRIYHTQVYMLLQMAMAITVGLGLDRYDNLKMQRMSHDEKGTEKASIFWQQMTMKHTDWVEYCADSLGKRAKYPTDQSLRALTGIYKDELLQSMDALENRIEHVLVQETQRNTWSLRLELNAIPAIVLEHALRRQRDLHWLYEKRRLLAIVRSVFNIVTVFLASPALVTPDLPMFSYTSIWYGLLVLSKLSFLSDAAIKGKAVEVYNKDTHNAGLAAMQKMETMSRRNDVWNNCCTSSRTQPQSIQVRGDTPNNRDAENAHMLPQPISEDPPQTTESVAVAEDSDASVWQHMLQDFPGIGLPVPNLLPRLRNGTFPVSLPHRCSIVHSVACIDAITPFILLPWDK
ncbi:hypothetical protein BDV40DRAFT_287875 [Aspergillus tamarii]|uniref:Transcription factor domain-containing protein n=1 Tax=Aspergillus tamarii TaxID=41984 RepID=A0A5N6UX93_ASPTM|nr:hypothetical protein BDV40DRAFT_287875 [Aspergillus tamarii]